ncbi:hypothetical protein GCM10010377_52260 [Streptomyces viridiviolaceus]|nr:hypothetical protein GCM10010377_52260 [Streptomyces viridiviolaceus]
MAGPDVDVFANSMDNEQVYGRTRSRRPWRFGVRDTAEVVDRCDRGGQGKLSACGGGGHQLPDAGRGTGGKQGLGAAVAASRLGDALDLVHRTGGQGAHVQQLHDGAGRAADR